MDSKSIIKLLINFFYIFIINSILLNYLIYLSISRIVLFGLFIDLRPLKDPALFHSFI